MSQWEFGWQNFCDLICFVFCRKISRWPHTRSDYMVLFNFHGPICHWGSLGNTACGKYKVHPSQLWLQSCFCVLFYFVFNLSLIFISRWIDQIKLQISWWWTDFWGCCSTPLWHPQPQFAQLRQFWHHQDKYFSEGGTSNISLLLLIHSFLLKWKLYR